MFATPEEVMHAHRTKRAHIVLDSYGTPAQIDYSNREAVAEAMAVVLRNHKARRGGNKVNRPWVIVDFSQHLPANESWLGWEIETGLRDQQDFDTVLDHVWHNYMHNTIDREGYGAFMAELSFRPTAVSEYDGENDDVTKLYKWFDEKGLAMHLPPAGSLEQVGTHVNISTPSLRARPWSINRLALLFRDASHDVNAARNIAAFGRVPYASRVYGRGVYGVLNRLEFKVFKSTRDSVRVQEYIRTAKRIAEVVEATAASGSSEAIRAPGGNILTCDEFFAYITQDNREEFRAAA